MTTKNSQKKQAKRGPEEARSQMLMLVSGQKGPLPLENDQLLQPQKSDKPTSKDTQSSAQEKTSGTYLKGVRERILDRYPSLTEEKLDRMLAET
jgi:hypothetical protein